MASWITVHFCVIFYCVVNNVCATGARNESTFSEDNHQNMIGSKGNKVCRASCGQFNKLDGISTGIFERYNNPVSSDVTVCNITSKKNTSEDSCVFDIWSLTNLTQQLNNSSLYNMIEIILKCNHYGQIVHFLETLENISTSDTPAVWLTTINCSVSWEDLSKFSAKANITVLNIIYADYARFNITREKINPQGFASIGTFAAWSVNTGSYVTDVLKSFSWPILAEISFFNSTVHYDDFTMNFTQMLPKLQTVELQYVPITKPPSIFPWNQDTQDLPNDLRRGHFFNNRHYAKGMEINARIYRRVLSLDYTQIRNLTGYKFQGFLHKISLKGNSIRDISRETFAEVKKLQVLDLSHNRISMLPTGVFDNLTYLLDLQLAYNNISQVPIGTFLQLSKLKLLNLRSNRIRIIKTNQFSGLQSLETLNLEENEIEYIERCTLTSEALKLKFVLLKGNRLTSIPICLFVSLMTVDLSYNRISWNRFNETLDSLQYIEIEWRNVDSASDSNVQESRVIVKTIINLQYNNITTLDMGSMTKNQLHVLYSLLNYFYFDLSGNPLNCDCRMYELYRYILTPDKVLQGTSLSFDLNIADIDFSTWKCGKPDAVKEIPIARVSNTTFECSENVPNCPNNCVCLVRAVDGSITVKCEDRNLTELPNKLPDSKNELILHVEGNRIQTLEWKDYFPRLTGLYLSRNNISHVADDILTKCSRLKVLWLDSNKLDQLPKSILSMTKNRLHDLNIEHNFFKCDCHSVWMKYWLRKSIGIVKNVQSIPCSTPEAVKGQSIIYVPDEKFVCINEMYEAQIAAITLGCLMVILISGFLAGYKYRLEVKILLYSKLNWHPFDRVDHDNDPDKIFDAFISYSSQDYRWVCHTLRSALENCNPKYRLCIHDRDFMVGAPIFENIMNSVKLSKRMIMVLSEDFIRSEWCMVEFRTAHQKVLREHSRYLIVLLLGDVATTDLDEELQLYLKTNTYLKVDDKLFWKRLLYTLPKPSTSRRRGVELEDCITKM